MYFFEKILIMKIIEVKKNFKIITLVISVLLFLSIINVNKAYALSCEPPEKIFIAAYEQGVFKNGFIVDNRGTGRGGCDSRQVVSGDIGNLQNVFSSASQNLNQPVSSGIYQLEKRCWKDSLGERCTGEATIKQVSDDPSELLRYKSEWQQKERKELLSAIVELSLTIHIFVTVVTFVILWPWVLLKIWPKLRKRLSSLLIIAILVQAYLIPVLVDMVMVTWSGDLLRKTALVSVLALLLTIIGEIVFIITRIIKLKNTPL